MFINETMSSNKNGNQFIGIPSLGVDENLNNWIELQKKNPVLVNSSVKSKEKLEITQVKLLELQCEIGEKYLMILNNIPDYVLPEFPGYNHEIFTRLKILNQLVKARIRQTKRKISSSEESPTENHFDDKVIIIEDDELSDEKKISQLSTNFSKDNDSSKLYVLQNTSIPKENYSLDYNLDKKNTYSLKQSRSLSTNEQSHLNNKKSGEKNNWVTMFNGSLTQSSKSSIDSGTIKSDFSLKKNAYDFYDIINVDQSKIFTTSIMCNDTSDDENFDEVESGKKEIKYLTSNDTFNLKKNSPDLDSTNSRSDDPESVVNFIGNVKNDGASGIFNNLNFIHCKNMLKIFKTKFGLHQFRPNQLAAINAAILGHDCFILMPTGGGKSLCYQLPALISHGVTIVISPLRSLIIDQKQKLDSLDISALYLTGDLSEPQVRAVYRKLNEVTTDLKLLYVTPEKLSLSPKFTQMLGVLHARSNLARFVIDEVHCVSQWGHDFRPDYNKLSMLKEKFPTIPMMALTATATERVRSDILHQLHLNDSCKWFISSFNRPNLRYSVIPKKAKSSNQQVVDLIKNKFKNECGIVYCISRKDCDNCAEILYKNGINALSYHAGLDDKLRIDRQTQWISEKVKVICATIAFGMGIDKPNVRFVIHAAMPKSIEGYYQESGRAGRDGEPADCILLYNYGDVYRYRNMIEGNQLSTTEALKTHLDNLCKMVHYCDNLSDCRRALQLNYFGEKFDRKDCIAQENTTCDNCKTFDRFVDVDVTKDAKALVELVCSLNQGRSNTVTILQVVDIYKGSDVSSIRYKLGSNYLKWFGQGKAMTKHEIERLLHKLIVDGYLCENMQLNNGIVCAYVVPGRLSREILLENSFQIFMHKKKVSEKTNQKASTTSQMSAVASAELKDLEQRCYSELMELVSGIAGALDVSANSIINMVALRTMSQRLPRTEAEMLKIPHVTKANFDKYGKALLDITQKFAQDKKEILEEEKEQRKIMNDIDFNQFEELDKDNVSPKIEKPKKTNKRCKTPKNDQTKKFKSAPDTRGLITPWLEKKIDHSTFVIEKPVNSNQIVKKDTSTQKKKFVPKKNHVNNHSNGPGLCELTKKK